MKHIISQQISRILALALLLSILPMPSLAVDNDPVPALAGESDAAEETFVDAAQLEAASGETVDADQIAPGEVFFGEGVAEVKEYQSRYYNFTKGTWTGADNQKMIQIARAQLGRNGISLGYSEPWCADFTCDTAQVAGVSNSVIPWNHGTTSAYVPYMSEWFTKNGAKEVSVEAAMPGDIVMFDSSRKDDSKRSPDYNLSHVAMVVYYDPVTKMLTYIGGNQGDKNGSKNREVTEVYYNTVEKHYVARVYHPNYATFDATPPLHNIEVTVNITGSGAVQGAGPHMQESSVVLTAVPNEGYTFLGWYDAGGTLLSESITYTFTAKEHITFSAKFGKEVQISATASRSGSVTGAGLYVPGQTATLTAVPASGKGFTGWYDANEKLVSEEMTYSFPVAGAASYQALFAGDEFMDIPAGVWYEEYAVRGKNLGLVNGVTALTFEGQTAFTRAMAAVMLCRMDGKESEIFEKPPFADLTKSWYVPGISWAYDAKVVKGVTNTEFQPDRAVTRQEFFTMVARYLAYKGYEIPAGDMPFDDKDEIWDFAKESVARLYSTGLVQGDTDGNVRPTDTLTRAEGTAVMVRLYDYMAANPLTPAEEPPEE